MFQIHQYKLRKIMGSCLGKISHHQYFLLGKQVKKPDPSLEAKLKNYQILNTELSAARNKELLAANLIIEELKNQNRELIDSLRKEIEEKEMYKNLIPIIV